MFVTMTIKVRIMNIVIQIASLDCVSMKQLRLIMIMLMFILGYHRPMSVHIPQLFIFTTRRVLLFTKGHSVRLIVQLLFWWSQHRLFKLEKRHTSLLDHIIMSIYIVCYFKQLQVFSFLGNAFPKHLINFLIIIRSNL